MQTFLPVPDYAEAAKFLDNKRLGKQRVEAWQILETLRTGRKAWSNHPAVKMWKGHEWALCQYGIAVCAEWKERGFRDTLMPRFEQASIELTPSQPDWIGRSDVHRSHQSNLLRKDLTHYGRYGWDVPSDLPYVWPVRLEEGIRQ